MNRRRLLRVAVVVSVFVVVAQAALVGAVAGTASAAPGLVGVPDSNVDVDLAGDSPIDVTTGDVEGAVSTSRFASTTHVTVTSGDRVDDSGGVSFGGAEDVVLVIRDDTNHGSREVTVDADLIRAVVGHIPSTVTGVHSSGETWVRQVDAGDGAVRFEVPKFSTNQVTFEGEFHASGTFSNGSSLTWGLTDLDAASEVTVNATGSSSVEWDNETASLVDGESTSVAFAGNAPLTGPSSNGLPTATITAPEGHSETDPGKDDIDSGYTAEIPYDGDTVGGLSINVATVDGVATPDHYTVRVEGQTIDSDWDPYNERSTSWGGLSIPVSGDSVTIEIDSDNQGEYDWYFDADGITVSFDGGASGVVLDASDGTSVGFGTINPGTSQSLEFPVTTDATQISLSQFEATELDVTVNAKETTAGSIDPSVELNDCTTAYDGTIPDGQTETLSLNADCLNEGTNRLNVTTGDGALSADAPESQVDLDITHDAVSVHEISVDDTRWRYAYNDSKTWASDRRDAIHTATLPSRVVAVDSVEIATDDGIWQETTDYTLTDGTLAVTVGDVSAGTKTEVRVTASKIVVSNGAITVTDPSTPDEALDSRFRIDSWTDDSYIAVGGTADGARIHYTYNESWDARAVSEVTAAGDQRLHLPGASAAESARVASLPIEAELDTGDARFHVADSSTRPTIEVRPGAAEGDEVTFRWLTPPSSGAVIEARGTTLDSDGSNPAILVDDDSEETIDFSAEGSSANSSTMSGGFWDQGGQQVVQTARDGGPLTAVLVFALVGLVVVGVVVLRDRAPGVLDRAPTDQPYLLGGVAVVLVIGLELLRPGTLSIPIRNAVDSALPLVFVLGTVIAAAAAAFALNRWRKNGLSLPVVGGSSDSPSGSTGSSTSASDGSRTDDEGTVVNIYE
ncbi:hypothetical protein ACFQL9_13070 [Halobaculum lipolyticum]|uniref:Uncharacterized protein n=1 Tax=Halobaculum lipolyticum TaxID=3032001 RepID=A0ABD5WFR1_9EURY